jgi:hypothetical protein
VADQVRGPCRRRVGHRDGGGVNARAKRDRGLEAAVAVAEQHAHAVASGDQVGDRVAVEVGHHEFTAHPNALAREQARRACVGREEQNRHSGQPGSNESHAHPSDGAKEGAEEDPSILTHRAFLLAAEQLVGRARSGNACRARGAAATDTIF